MNICKMVVHSFESLQNNIAAADVEMNDFEERRCLRMTCGHPFPSPNLSFLLKKRLQVIDDFAGSVEIRRLFGDVGCCASIKITRYGS